ncbi:MAG: hypothetical protein AB7Q37_09790 [Pyrinomonadaceae bacterium]
MFSAGCAVDADIPPSRVISKSANEPPKVERITNSSRVIHVLVALCDNENQGIVPVPAHLGNGEDPGRNLYWGAAYGIKTYFDKSPNWSKVAEFEKPANDVLERIVFKHKSHDIYLIADAYRGSKMRQMVDVFFSAASGKDVENISVRDLTLQVLGSSDLIVFVGHNGLMDFKYDGETLRNVDGGKREAIILACASRNYFSKHLKPTGSTPLLWTTNLMAPEAYILHDAIEGWARRESNEQIRSRAAAAYAKYQRISKKAAEGLLVTGW